MAGNRSGGSLRQNTDWQKEEQEYREDTPGESGGNETPQSSRSDGERHLRGLGFRNVIWRRAAASDCVTLIIFHDLLDLHVAKAAIDLLVNHGISHGKALPHWIRLSLSETAVWPLPVSVQRFGFCFLQGEPETCWTFGEYLPAICRVMYFSPKRWSPCLPMRSPSLTEVSVFDRFRLGYPPGIYQLADQKHGKGFQPEAMQRGGSLQSRFTDCQHI